MSPWESLAALYPIVALSATKQLYFSLCVFEWSNCFLWLLKFIFLLFCSFCTILIQGHFQEISWSQLPAGSLSPPSPGVFTTSRSLPEGDDQPCSVVHFSWYAFVSVTNLDYPQKCDFHWLLYKGSLSFSSWTLIVSTSCPFLEGEKYWNNKR